MELNKSSYFRKIKIISTSKTIKIIQKLKQQLIFPEYLIFVVKIYYLSKCKILIFFHSFLLRRTEWQNACFQIKNKITLAFMLKNLYINKLNTIQSTAIDALCNHRPFIFIISKYIVSEQCLSKGNLW